MKFKSNIELQSGLKDSSGGLGTSGQVLSTTGTATSWTTLASGGTVTSVAQAHSGNAFSVTGSPITASGTLTISVVGTAAQYINGAGNLITFPTIPTNNNQLTNGAGYITSSALSPYLTVANPTFTGTLTGPNGIYINDAVPLIIKSATAGSKGNHIQWQNSTGTPRFYLGFETANENFYLDNPGGNTLFYNGGLALTLDSSQNATFAGTLAVSGSGDSYFTGNLGIGVTGPDTKLHISGSVGTSSIIKMSVSNGTAWEFGERAAAGKFTFRELDGNKDVLTMMSIGNVGVGTTSPHTLLTVNDSNVAGETQLAIGDVYTYHLALGHNSAGNTDGFIGTIYNSDLARFDIRMKGSAQSDAKVTVLGDGNVGIGETNPTKKIDVYQSTVGIGVADFKHVNGNRILINPSYNYYDAYNHIFRGLNGTSTHMTIDASGNVGIGTTIINDPFTTTAAFQIGNINLATDNSLLTMGSGNQGSGDIYFADSTSGGGQYRGWLSYKHISDYMTIGTAGAERMRIDSAGNTTFTGTGAFAGGSYINNDSANALSVTSSEHVRMIVDTSSTGGHRASYVLESNGNEVDIATSGSGEMQFATGGIERVRIDSSNATFTGNIQANGGVAINGGTSAPGRIHKNAYVGLNLRGIVGSSGYDVSLSASSGALGLTIATGAGNVKVWESLQVSGAGDSYFTGDVGIGITLPDTKLDVNGTIRSNASGIGKLFLGNNAQSKPGGAIIGERSPSYSSTGKLSFQVPTWGANSDYGLTTQMTIETTGADTKAATMVLLPWGGDVGIGTTLPNAKLEVSGSIRIDSKSKAGSGEVDNITFTKDRPDAATGAYEMGAIRSFTTNGYSGGMTFYTGRHTGGGGYGLIATMTIGNTSDIGLANVGIGTTTPTGKLTVETTGNHLHLRNSAASTGQYWNFDVAMNNRLYILDNGNTGVSILDGATSWTGVSDESLKENIKPLTNVLDKIKNYRCVEYNLKTVPGDKKIGFIAQDWENDFAPIVDKDEDGILGMKYTETIPVLLKAIQELQAKIEILEQK